MKGTVLISGATGFLGRAACHGFTAAGYDVRALVRQASSAADLQNIACGGVFVADLPQIFDEDAFAGVDAVIHCAFATKGGDQASAEEVNMQGTRRMRELATKHSIQRFIFVSSMAYHNAARSTYGRTKWTLESELTSPRVTIAKPGTILGKGGVFARTKQIIQRLPLVPLLYASARLQVIDLDDVVKALITIVEQNTGGTLNIAHQDAVTVRHFYEGIMDLSGVRKPLVPVPGDLALLAAKTAENLGFTLPITSDNLLGLKYLHYFDATTDLARLGLTPLSFKESLARLKASPAK